jgi:hypothetical protein
MHVLGGVIAVVAQLSTASPCPTATPAVSPTLIVQTVDQLWLPLPGAEVRVRSNGKGRHTYTGTTDRNGYLGLVVPAGEYVVDASLVGFKVKPVKAVTVSGKEGESAPHVQLQLKVKAPDVTLE